MRMVFQLAVLAVLLVYGDAGAQAPPKPAEFYFDDDRSARIPAVETDDVTVKRLMQTVERGGRNADKAHAQLAAVMVASGRLENGVALYQQLLDRLDSTNGMRRPVQWQYGWALVRAGKPAAALEQFAPLVQGRGINPSWAPPTLALLLWQLDRKQEAVAWYAAAVRTEPRLWSTPARHAELLPDWTEDDRATLAKVQAAWAAEPPQWP